MIILQSESLSTSIETHNIGDIPCEINLSLSQPSGSSRAIEKAQKDDQDELPWQVIAILDRETVRDMRYTFKCTNIVKS